MSSDEKTAARQVQQQPGHSGPLSRWAKRKQAVLEEQQQAEQAKQAGLAGQEEAALPVLTDEDMPPLSSLTPDSDYSGFLSPGVSDELRRLALRKLFHSPAFNVVDGLDDYDGDYTSFAKLGDVVTAEMRHRVEQEARRELQRAKDVINEQTEPLQLADELPQCLDQPSEVIGTNHDRADLIDNQDDDEIDAMEDIDSLPEELTT